MRMRTTFFVLIALSALPGCIAEDANAIDGPGSTGGVVGQGGNRGGGGSTGGSGGTADASTGDEFTLRVDAPVTGSTVGDAVVVRGSAPGFKNVEAWDPLHQSPALAQTTPGKSGAFSFTVDTRALAAGPTTWTIWAWDAPPGAPATHTASVDIDLTIVHAATVGTGSIEDPAIGPMPKEATKIGGTSWVLVKNWDFGENGTVQDIASLSSEFEYHDQFGTIGNGTKYGAVTVAPNAATALPNQPVEDPARPYREFTADSMKAYVRPLTTTQMNVSVTAHNAGNGSIMAKWKLPSGGAIYGKDLLWETRARMPVTVAAYWFAIWTSGNKWNQGAEMDVLESFGTPNIYPPPTAFFANCVGGTSQIDYGSWPVGLTAAGVPESERDLREWHTWTWLYRANDTFVAYYDGHVIQTGNMHWTLGGAANGEPIDMSFLLDFSWGHTEIQDVNVTLPAQGFGITYEVDYSRVYLR